LYCFTIAAANPDPSSPLKGSLPSLTPINGTSDASGDETTGGEPICPIGQKKAKIVYQEVKLDASNHKALKKMAGAHVDVADIVKKQQSVLASKNSLEHIPDEAIMSKYLTGTNDTVKKLLEFCIF
jgi:hypothetical protein